MTNVFILFYKNFTVTYYQDLIPSRGGKTEKKLYFIFLPVKKTKISSSLEQVGSPQRKMCYQNFETEKTNSPNFISKELKYC